MFATIKDVNLRWTTSIVNDLGAVDVSVTGTVALCGSGLTFYRPFPTSTVDL